MLALAIDGASQDELQQPAQLRGVRVLGNQGHVGQREVGEPLAQNLVERMSYTKHKMVNFPPAPTARRRDYISAYQT